MHNIFCFHNYARRPCQLILLGDGLDEAVEACIAGHQHQGEHGDHFHCAGEGGMFCESLTKNSEPYLQAFQLLEYHMRGEEGGKI